MNNYTILGVIGEGQYAALELLIICKTLSRNLPLASFVQVALTFSLYSGLACN